MSDLRVDALRRYADRFGHDLGAVRARLLAGDKTPAGQIATDNGLPAAAGSGPATFYADFTAPHGRRHIRVCGAAACTAASGGTQVADVEAALHVSVDKCRDDGEVSLQEVRCLGYCYAGPAALDGDKPCAGQDIAAQLTGTRQPQDPPITVQADCPEPVVTAGLLSTESSWAVWPEVISRSEPTDVLAEVAAARLRGRGGAGFPAARKWTAARTYPQPRVVVANGDEGDPGSYVDRLLMERDPDRVLEGLALASFAVEAEQAIVFIRGEYPRARERVEAAIRKAYDDGHFGPNVHGSGRTLDVRVESGAGSYVSGEETALLNAIEGLRGVVRPRPPYPVEHGLDGRPTVVNNVETLATVPWIVRHGGAAYARFGTADENGTVVACLSERFARPGAYEVEIGTPVRHLVEDLGGGLRDRAILRSVQVGGPLGGFLSPGDLDLPLSEAALSSRGAALGHAGIVAFDDRLTGADVLRHIWRFAATESCGECSPCRVGTSRGLRLAELDATTDVVRARTDVLRTLAAGSLCAFGRRVPAAIRSVAEVYGLEGWT
ncbi:NADH:ubiquinone oxidoreductase subunit F (NADH-binding) [Kribbella orskensis]|uniref:NADH:ubiquinone oxidoreductase subunit F (NADH-binding) n=1 Tax=Kribbella orskensis TaxID=2512216 RepID=A0ABY2B6X3_9ACTN|nr:MULTISPECIES: NAD(P)H-dependent oxidoreductase subunit E [Kribbella]TCN29634.1 NADH:ubiquinone oxidoreductase subunit F (NADH-binding) [Kribbella sp. VKM Ac-2500]TCO09932.1 NADH:ubiquinone oxidoreductase subunit F (NADH-binding) [Kribbella orskensis]